MGTAFFLAATMLAAPPAVPAPPAPPPVITTAPFGSPPQRSIAIDGVRISVGGKAWPTVPPGPMLSGPDWADYNIYPAEARALEQEGSVRSALLIDEQGRTIDCEIIVSSGYRALDEGTCARMKEILWQPASVEGKAVQSSRTLAISWQLGDQLPITRSTAASVVRFESGRPRQCSIAITGPAFKPFERSGCLSTERLVNLLAPLGDRTFRIELIIVPETEDMGKAPKRLLASRRVQFGVNDEGDPVDCAVVGESGDMRLLGPATPGMCDDQLRRLWFAQPGEDDPQHGLYEIRIIDATR